MYLCCRSQIINMDEAKNESMMVSTLAATSDECVLIGCEFILRDPLPFLKKPV
jgi:hypothetical protein